MKAETFKMFGEIPEPKEGRNAEVIMKSASEVAIPDGVKEKKVRLGVHIKSRVWQELKPITFFAGFVEIDKIIYPYTGHQYGEGDEKETKIMIIKKE